MQECRSTKHKVLALLSMFVLPSTFVGLNKLQLLAIPPPLLTPNTLKSPSGNFYRCVMNISISMELLNDDDVTQSPELQLYLDTSLSLPLSQFPHSTDALHVFHFARSQTRPRVPQPEA